MIEMIINTTKSPAVVLFDAKKMTTTKSAILPKMLLLSDLIMLGSTYNTRTNRMNNAPIAFLEDNLETSIII